MIRPGKKPMQGRHDTVLVTGAAGFIGQSVCSELCASGYQVRSLLRSADQAQLFSPQQNVDCPTGDLLDLASLQSACVGVDVVIHLAGIAHVDNISEKKLQEVNTDGTANILKAASENQVKRIVFLSSSLAQAAEMDSPHSTAYGRSKLAAEQLLQVAQKQGAIEVVILRPVNVFGPGMKGNINRMISMISKGRLPPLPKLDSRLSLVGVEDLAGAITLATDATEADGKTYYVTDGVSYSVNEMEQAIYAALDKKIPAWRTPRMVLYAAAAAAGCLGKLLNSIGLKRDAGGISGRTYQNLITDNLFSNGPLCEELGFTPKSNFYDSLSHIIETIDKHA
ncbi:MAG: SDR family NAD(P)-dependent oxidoreductase [Gammaproteobacteria bacterium]|jgi:nucleoside-diphosphate-sugar epimerase|nr:SDR family NAD(P)-dependent oxidoreductase [Gammaproteobacteria bacterium]